MEDLENSLPALKIDVATWRRDIQTFVDMTIDELTAINDQLASPFSEPSSRRVWPVPELAARNRESDSEGLAANECSRVHPSRTDERLNSLKRKLAAKLSGNSQANQVSG